MEIFLQILGGIVLFAVIVVVAFYLYIRIKLGKYYNYISDEDMTPLQIHLNEDMLPEWLDDRRVQALEKELLSLRFSEGKAYEVVEMEGMKLKSFVKPHYIAVLYTHPIAGVWVDIVAESTDGIEYTLTSAPMGEEIETPPNTQKYYLPQLNPKELYDKLLESVQNKELVDISKKDFREFFEEVYKKEMRWKNQNGGYSYEDFLRTVAADNKKYSQKEQEEAWIEIKRKELHKWHKGAIDEHIESLDQSEDRCEDLRYNLFIVPSKSDNIAFLYYLQNIGLFDENQKEKYIQAYSDEKDITMLFAKIFEALSPGLRPVKKAQVDYPLDITIYELVDL